MTRRITILGSGSSAGVPRIGNDWGQCDPAEPRNRRRRCSALVTQSGPGGETRVLIDTSPDLREQFLSSGTRDIDAVLYTHEHADHTHGIDDLRAVFLMKRKRVEIWADDATGRMLTTRFAYCFYAAPGSDYPPILNLNAMEAGTPVTIGGAGGAITALPFRVHHGTIDALGFRFNGVAYTPDIDGVPDDSLHQLEGLDLWIVDALRRTPHPSHWSLQQTLAWIARMKPKRAIITNLHIDMDYATLMKELPAGVEPAYDGLDLVF
ncbi:MAG: MBL fold metallo-hydrolase [Aestuariivirga sp.]|uniref:MBL fold metallo-hydrolase n=1 Tax=Aestuariivirga sp. TaxID=2650926 RepID=UPI0025C59776|nr:MBL fold metallo-hydrolase [Aestuariivirga sp.]MCA3560921.1 MBL fold metallo-hydrolase [Aestuariivirga sp.]